ncbi:maleylpyruvate isomerase N-terminal domain-containing protein [Symbioplanes lichenis]|uniref:maleylpyruvate isomerase N-terminal domain-containing protein n=1 Tax=Symbioplanes lichenis TaxID=1629072 RepID=UPI0027391D13|nr:maleylpyruvate isomerase N-terminal domain-containing protein [Actinoplanes lichenis]
MDFRWAYKSAVATFTDLVYRVPEDRWDGPGLGEWTLRELTGHVVGSALREVPRALGGPAATVDVASPEGYWAFAQAAPAEVVAAVRAAATEDARKTAAEFGVSPAAGVAEYARAATQALSAAGDADVVLTAVGGMRVREWIPTRTFELVVHGLDVAAAAGAEVEFAEEVLAAVTLQAARVAATSKEKTLVLRALTGRATLPPDFSVV